MATYHGFFKASTTTPLPGFVDTIGQAGLHIMGARTYRDMAAHWPTSTEPFAPPMNTIPKAVFSSTLTEAPWGETQILRGDLADEITRLKTQPGRNIVAHGGAGFARSLVRLNLIDEYHLMVHPVALGRGLTIFSDLPEALPLTLVDSIRFPKGTMAQIYRK